MKKSRFTDGQIMAILKLAEAGTPVAELCREHGMSSASFYYCAGPAWINHGYPGSYTILERIFFLSISWCLITAATCINSISPRAIQL
ncbi:Uncharacterised protein [Serratia proteamaculans]|nr:Uncharacterised protein [Serratia proteamaculans]